MNIVVGGKAMQHHGFKRSTLDFDVWTTDSWGYVPKGFDVSVMPVDIMELMERGDGLHATLNDLYTIKLSHLTYDIFWWKHVQDVLLLKSKGVQLNLPLYHALCKYWEGKFKNTVLGKKQLSLYKTKDQFFDDFVVKQHDHDYLHELVAHPFKPLYTRCLVEGQEVLIDREKFNQLQFPQRVEMFREEIAVIALERWVIPSNRGVPICHAWTKSLHKVVTSLTKGWASRFIIENIELFLSPMKDQMEYALRKLHLNEKEIDMTFNEFEQYLEEVWVKNGGVSRWGFDVYEIILEGDADAGIELLHQSGGGEGGAESCYSVLKVEDKIYKVSYSYYSHHGFEFDYAEVKEVWAKQKLITVYE